MKKIISVLLVFSALQLFAQTPEKLIPADADNVISINLASLSQKINLNDLSNFTFLQNPNKDLQVSSTNFIKEFFRFPEKAGINTNGKIILYSENHDSISCFTYLIPISGNKAFKNRTLEILKNPTAGLKFEKKGKYEILNYNSSLCISYIKNTAVISMWNKPYYYVYDEDIYTQQRSKIIAIIDSINYAKSQVETPIPEETKPDTIALENIDTAAAVTEEVQSNNYYNYYDYNNDSLIKQFERKWAAEKIEKEASFWIRHDTKMSGSMLRIFNLINTATMASDAGFNKVFNLGNDFIIWIPINNYSKKIISLFDKKKYYYDSTGTYKEIPSPETPANNKLSELLSNNLFYGFGNFEKGKVTMKFNFECNEKIKPYVEKINSGKINPDFFNYIKSDNLIGFACASINAEAWSDFYLEIFRRAMESNSNPNKNYMAGLELADLLINRDVIFHTFRGDGVLAITGMKSFLKTYKSWEYDSITFESRTVERTKTQYVPEFVYILTVENQTYLNKILSIGQRLGGLKQSGNNIWILNSGKSEIDSNFYFVKNGDLFFVTNDYKLAYEQIQGGMATTRVVGNTFSSQFANSSFGYWDASAMFKLMADNNENNTFGKTSFLNKLGEKINNAAFSSKPINGNTSQTEMSFELKNRENSSLLEILGIFDDLNKIK